MENEFSKMKKDELFKIATNLQHRLEQTESALRSESAKTDKAEKEARMANAVISKVRTTIHASVSILYPTLSLCEANYDNPGIGTNDDPAGFLALKHINSIIGDSNGY